MAKQSKVKLPKVEVLPSGSCRIRATVKVLVNGEVVKQVKSFTGATPEECYAAYHSYKNAEEPKQAVSPPKAKTLASAMDEYINFRREAKSPSTIRGYDIIRRNAFQELMDIRLDKITRAQWQEAIDNDIRAGLSPKTIKNRVDLVRFVLRENSMPVPKFILPDDQKSEDDTEDFVRFLDDVELEKFKEVIFGKENELMCYLALNSLRCSEIYALTWDKINAKEKNIVVLGAAVPDSDNKLVLKDSNKNATSRRTVPVFFPRLMELVEQADKTKPITNITPNGFYKWINRICEENGMNEIGIHGLRHTGASLCLYKGVRKTTIIKWFGWKDEKMLNKIYSHMSRRQELLEVEKLNQGK